MFTLASLYKLIKDLRIAVGMSFIKHRDIQVSLNNEINLDILLNIISVLKDIEEGKLDQHSGAFEVGKVLKEMYIDSALLKAERTDKKTGVKIAAESLVEGKQISWSDYKLQRTQVEAAIKSKDIPAQ